MVKAKDLMNRSVITIGPDEDLYEALRRMALNHITGLPVVAPDETLLGIITEKDLLILLCNRLENPSVDEPIGPVGDFMTRNVVCFEPDDNLRDVTECLSLNNFRRVPILEQGKLVGIISRRDIIQRLRNLQQQEEVARDGILELLY